MGSSHRILVSRSRGLGLNGAMVTEFQGARDPLLAAERYNWLLVSCLPFYPCTFGAVSKRYDTPCFHFEGLSKGLPRHSHDIGPFTFSLVQQSGKSKFLRGVVGDLEDLGL